MGGLASPSAAGCSPHLCLYMHPAPSQHLHKLVSIQVGSACSSSPFTELRNAKLNRLPCRKTWIFHFCLILWQLFPDSLTCFTVKCCHHQRHKVGMLLEALLLRTIKPETSLLQQRHVGQGEGV